MSKDKKKKKKHIPCFEGTVKFFHLQMIFHILFNISYVENHFLFLREYMFDSGSKLGINKIILALSLYYDVKF